MLLTRDPDAFLDAAPRTGKVPHVRGLLMVRPDGFRLSDQSIKDNRYMKRGTVDPTLAKSQHAAVVEALETAGYAIEVVPGDPACPEACFLNNAFATTERGAIYGSLRHVDRAEEPRRPLVRKRLDSLGYNTVGDLSGEAEVIAELTGSLIIDHARNVGFLGMSERVNQPGAERMAELFGLEAILQFDLTSAEYHTNTVLAVLPGKGAVIASDGFADPAIPQAIADFYDDSVVWLTPSQKRHFAANLLALDGKHVAMSAAAAEALGEAGLGFIRAQGYTPLIVPIGEIEKGGGSIRCLLCELW
ncbi:MAG: arginine deiminase-related protein [bacterium]